MKREILKTKLLAFGYSSVMVRKLLQGTTKPTANKMFSLEEKFNIPVYIWKDIKSYLKNDTAQHQHKSTTNQNKDVA